MKKKVLNVVCICLLILVSAIQKGYSTGLAKADTARVLDPGVLQIVNIVLKASYTYQVEKVAGLYAPNAVITDEQEPYSWNGQLAGVQWINSIQKAVKDFKIKDFKVNVKRIKVFQQTDDIAYLIVPVEYTGNVNGEPFDEEGAFSFVMRVVSGKWLIKSQAWVPRKGM